MDGRAYCYKIMTLYGKTFQQVKVKANQVYIIWKKKKKKKKKKNK